MFSDELDYSVFRKCFQIVSLAINSFSFLPNTLFVFDIIELGKCLLPLSSNSYFLLSYLKIMIKISNIYICFYERKTWPLILREITVSVGSVVMNTFGPKKKKVIERGRKIRNKELQSTYI
jgi:hypothetical protein